MKRIPILLILLLFVSPVFAQNQTLQKNTLPQGVFKKSINGKIIQYDNNGKKIGTYKLKNGRYVRVK